MNWCFVRNMIFHFFRKRDTVLPPLHLPGRPVRVQRPVPNQSPELETLKQIRQCRRDCGPVPEEEQSAQDGQARPPLSCPSKPRRSGQCPVSRSPLAPDAFRGARTIAPSIKTYSKSGSSDNAPETRWKTPLLARRRKIAPRTPRPHPLKPSRRHSSLNPLSFASCAFDGAC